MTPVAGIDREIRVRLAVAYLGVLDSQPRQVPLCQNLN